jgi:hypothetical protein
VSVEAFGLVADGDAVVDQHEVIYLRTGQLFIETLLRVLLELAARPPRMASGSA